jgi:histidinol-phosphate aminotransferase
MLEARAAVRGLQPYVAPPAEDRPVRLHLNENAWGCSPRVLEALHTVTASEIARYPQREAVERLVAERMGLEAEQVLLTNGADEALHLACMAYLETGTEAITVIPTFTLYSVYSRATGTTLLEIPALDEFRFPLEAVLRAIGPRTRLVIIAAPNNPTGACVAEADILSIAAAVPDAAVLVDEAYSEFCGRSVLSQIGSIPNLLVARTFSKAYGLAGLRAGFLAGDTQQIAAIRRFCSPFNVNLLALRCLPAALADEEYMQSYVRAVIAGRDELGRELAAVGISIWPSGANFVLAKLGDDREAFLASTAQAGIGVRDRHDQPLCAGCVRISVGTEEQNRSVIEIARRLRVAAPGVRK